MREKRLALLLALLALSASIAVAAAVQRMGGVSPGAEQEVVVEVKPGAVLHSMQAPVILLRGVPPGAHVEVTARYVVRESPGAWYTVKPLIEGETGVYELPVLRLPSLCGDCLAVVAPPGPVGVIVYNSSSLGLRNREVVVNSTLYVNVTVNGELVATLSINFSLPVEGEPVTLIAANTSVAALTVEEGGSIPVCGVAIGPPRPSLNLTLWSPLDEEWIVVASGGVPLAGLDGVAKAVNDTLRELTVTLLEKLLLADSYTEPPYTGPGAVRLCVELEPGSLGARAGDTLLLAFEHLGVYTPLLPVYVERGGLPAIAVLDPMLNYTVAAATPTLQEYRDVLEAYGLLGEAYWGAVASTAATVLRSAWSKAPLPDWGPVAALGSLDVYTSVSALREALERRVYSLVVYASPLWPMPSVARAAEELLARGAADGEYSLLLLGPIAPRFYAWRTQSGVSVAELSGYRGVLAALAGLTHALLVYVNASSASLLDSLEPGAAAMLYTPPVTPGIGALISTRWSAILGLQPGLHYAVETPLPASLEGTGYTFLTSLEWSYETGRERYELLASLLKQPEYHSAVSKLYSALSSLYEGLPGLEYSSVAAIDAYMRVASRLSTGYWLGPSMRYTGGSATLPDWAYRLATMEPAAKPVFETPDGAAAILYRDLCSAGVRVVYSTVPLQLGGRDAPKLLSMAASLALTAPQCKRLPGGGYADGAIVDPSRLSGGLVYQWARILLASGGTTLTICTQRPSRLVLEPLDYNTSISLYLNGSSVEPVAVEGGARAYSIEPGCWNVSIEAKSLYAPERILAVLYTEPIRVTETVTVTRTVTETTTVYRNVTVPAGTVTRTVYVTTTLVKRTTVTETTTTTLYSTITTTSTVTETRFTTVTRVERVTETLYSTVTLPPRTTTVTSVKTLVEKVTVTSPVTVTVEAPPTRQLVFLAAGLAAGAAIGFLAPRLASRAGR